MHKVPNTDWLLIESELKLIDKYCEERGLGLLRHSIEDSANKYKLVMRNRGVRLSHDLAARDKTWLQTKLLDSFVAEHGRDSQQGKLF